VRTCLNIVESLSGRGDRTAVVAFGAGDPQTLSYRQLAERIAGLSQALREAGVAPDDHAVLFAPNSQEWIISYFAVIAAGGVIVPVDDQTPREVLAHILDVARPRVVLTVSAHADALGSLAGDARVIVIDVQGSWDRSGAGPQLDLEIMPHRDAQPDDPAALLFTSGTTGMPKAVPLSHRNLVFNVDALLEAGLITPDDRVLVPLPLYHAYPCTVGLLGSMAIGATLLLPASVTGPALMTALKEGRATGIIGVPRLYGAIVEAIDDRVRRLGSLQRRLFHRLMRVSIACRRLIGLRVGRLFFARLHREIGPELRILACGGAKLEPDIAWKLEGLGWEVLTGYGLTETSPMLTFSPRGQGRIGTEGRPLPGIDLRIDASGEIQARGPSVFSGYRDDPDATRSAFTADGWFCTGDLGCLDAAGYLEITARRKDIIVLPDGKNVMAAAVEQAYAASAVISEIVVFERNGRLTALVVPDEEGLRHRGTVREATLLRYEIEDAGLRLPGYQRISEYRLTRTPLPRTRLGKLQRHLIPDLFEHAGAPAPRAPTEISDEDRELLDTASGRSIWAWLEERFPDAILSPDTSPQLDLHVDSLGWLSLSLEIQEQFGVSMDTAAISRVLTLRDLIGEIQSAAQQPVGAETPESAYRKWLRPPGVLRGFLALLLATFNRVTVRLFFRLEIAGAEKLPLDRPVLIAPNHLSYLDPFVVAAALPFSQLKRTCWAGLSDKLFAGPFSRSASRLARVFPVDPDKGLASGIEDGLAVLRQGDALVWFPEGRRSPTGELRPFLPGAGILIEQTGVDAVPVHIEGTFEALPRDKAFPRPGRVRVSFGEPVSAARLEKAGTGQTTAERITDALHQSVAALTFPEHTG
jgi:long-chain acyl-CoA synthetase